MLSIKKMTFSLNRTDKKKKRTQKDEKLNFQMNEEEIQACINFYLK